MKLLTCISRLGLSVFVLVAMSCTHKEKIEPPSVIPEIKLITTSPGQVKAFEDEIRFVIEYTDGDGDLGTNDDKVRNVFVKDNRVDVIHEFRLQQLAPDNATIAITGTFEIKLPNTIIDGNSAPETVTCSISVVDRAGNESNEVTSPEITVVE